MKTAPIPRVRGLSPEWFRNLYERPRLPVVLAGALEERVALGSWSFEHLAAEGDVEVAVRVSPREGPQLFDGDPGKSFEYRKLTLREAIAGIERPSNETWYVQHVELASLPRLNAEVGPLEYAPSGERSNPRLWVCGGGTKNPLHWDTHHAALAQITGEKRFVVFSPADSAKLATFTHRTLWRTTGLDLSAIDAGRYPRLGEATGYSCTVRPGDVLFVPYGFWHYMECDAPAVSVTWWWPPSRAAHVRDSVRERIATLLKRVTRLRDGARPRRAPR